LAACAAAALAGCAMDNPFLVARNANGKPTVWDCAVVQMSTPPRYACTDDKTYTAFQLRDFRQASNPSANSLADK
jgi:hypothetical protein